MFGSHYTKNIRRALGWSRAGQDLSGSEHAEFNIPKEKKGIIGVEHVGQEPQVEVWVQDGCGRVHARVRTCMHLHTYLLSGSGEIGQ